MDFAHFGLESGMVFAGEMNVFIARDLSLQFQKSKKEREICKLEMDVKKYFLLLFLSK